jgi:hypothetical protein
MAGNGQPQDSQTKTGAAQKKINEKAGDRS